MDVQEEMNTSQRMLTKSIEIVNLTAEASEKKFKVSYKIFYNICFLLFLQIFTN